MCRLLSVSVNCTRSPTAKSASTVLRLEPHIRAAQLAALAPHLPQLGVDLRHVGVGIGEHEPARLRVGQRVAFQRATSAARAASPIRGPGDRAVPVIRGDGGVEPALGQVACRLALPAHLLPRHLGDLGRAVRVAAAR